MGRSLRTVILTLSGIAVLLGIRVAFAAEEILAPEPRISASPGRFVDIAEKLGIHFRHQASPTSKKYLIETMGSGVAVFDCDNDGRLDIFFANGARLADPTPKGTIPKKSRHCYGINYTQ